MSTITYSGELVVTSCWCGIRVAIPNGLYRLAQNSKDEKAIYCPLGHSFVYRNRAYIQAQQRAADAERRLTSTRAQLDQARADRDHQEARVRGYQGALAKSKKRAAKGVCPVPGCKRHFADMQRHIASKHPDWCGDAGLSPHTGPSA